jgi:hypothetical protein
MLFFELYWHCYCEYLSFFNLFTIGDLVVDGLDVEVLAELACNRLPRGFDVLKKCNSISHVRNCG